MPVDNEIAKVDCVEQVGLRQRLRRHRSLLFVIAVVICTFGLFLHRDWLFVVGFTVFIAAFIASGGV